MLQGGTRTADGRLDAIRASCSSLSALHLLSLAFFVGVHVLIALLPFIRPFDSSDSSSTIFERADKLIVMFFGSVFASRPGVARTVLMGKKNLTPKDLEILCYAMHLSSYDKRRSSLGIRRETLNRIAIDLMLCRHINCVCVVRSRTWLWSWVCNV